jgi:hypothetical protein
MPNQEQSRSPEDQRDGGGRSGIAGMCDSEFIGCGKRYDPGYQGNVEVGVGGAGQPSRILGGGDDPTGRLGAAGEVDQPQRHTAEEGHHERRHRDRGGFDLTEGRAGH